ncbi:MCM2/3/5 family-domain-containing protein [Pavlovales sp. CCMP2436]|nr:MCM2/3/5 family-domain-containing protein [Pavlovales sp. CCMP2436]
MPPAAPRDPESDVVEDPSNVLEDPKTDDPRTDQPSADADDAADAHAGAANGAGGAAGRGAPLEEEDDGEDLMGDGMAADYRRMGALDEYEEDGIDRADYSDDVDARGAADRELAARDATDVYGRSRGPRAFQDSSGDEDDAFQRRNHRQAAETAEGEGLGMDALNAAEVVEPNLDAFDPVKTSLAEWIAQPNISASVKRLFHRFLQTFTVGGTTAGNYYVEAVRTMCSHNRESLEVSYRHLSAHAPILAIWLADCPSAMLPLFDEEAMRFVCHYFNEYRRIQPEVHVRISELPIHDSIRDLRQVHLGCLVKVSGVVTRRTAVFPMLKMVKFDCPKCGAELGPYAQQASNSEVRPTDCHDCHSKGPFVLNVEQTVYRNYQKVTVQESPGTVPAGRLPRHKEVVLLGDLIDVARPGEEVEFLKYIEKTAHRAVYATGQGASAVGLTASVHRDQVTREWTLEGGALVLADRGVCLIDEFDKMNDQDRTSIHEAMEQQSISISKAGIVTSLQARCAVIAAANPINGRYEPTLSFADNVELSEPILSRFDVTCILRDTANVVMDETLAGFVIDSHKRSHPDNVKAMQAGAPAADVATDARRTAALSASGRPIIEQALLRKFIVYARHHCKPVLQDVDTDKLVKFYTELRRESAKSGGIVVAVRHLESLIRLAEATARTQLRSHVRNDDIDLAISVMLRSFINSQKHTIAQAMERKFARYLNLRRDVDELLVFILNRLFNEHLEGQRNTRLQQGIPEEDIESIDIEVPVTQFEDKAREHNCYELGDFYTSHAFAAHGYQRENDQIFRVKQ